MTRFWLGGHGPDLQADAVGIGVLEGDDVRAATTLAYRGVGARLASPSWLARHPVLDVVYAALEGEGSVVALARSGEQTLRQLGPALPVGDSPCHIAVAPGGSSLIVSCVGDGRVVRIGLDAEGRMQQRHIAPAVTDPYDPQLPAGQQEPSLAEILAGGVSLDAASGLDWRSLNGIEVRPGVFEGSAWGFDPTAASPAAEPEPAAEPLADARVSRAHAAAFLADGRVVTTDLGFDAVRFWRPTASGLRADGEVVLPRGVGPRHMVVHPSGHLHVVTEYSCEVFTLGQHVDRSWAVVASTTVSPIATVGADLPAELSRSRDAETLYAGVRGSNTIAALRVRESGMRVEPIALADAGVDWPRHHLVHEGQLLVAGQRSGEISVLDLDDRTGVPGRIRHRASVPSPTHILPMG